MVFPLYWDTIIQCIPCIQTEVKAKTQPPYERGERVHLAMLSRGYTGRLPR